MIEETKPQLEQCLIQNKDTLIIVERKLRKETELSEITATPLQPSAHVRNDVMPPSSSCERKLSFERPDGGNVTAVVPVTAQEALNKEVVPGQTTGDDSRHHPTIRRQRTEHHSGGKKKC